MTGQDAGTASDPRVAALNKKIETAHQNLEIIAKKLGVADATKAAAPDAAPAPAAKPDAGKPGAAPKFVKGQTYTDAKGNHATWDGTKFVPAQ